MFGALFFAGYAFFSHLLPENCSKPDFVPRYIRVSAYLWH